MCLRTLENTSGVKMFEAKLVALGAPVVSCTAREILWKCLYIKVFISTIIIKATRNETYRAKCTSLVRQYLALGSSKTYDNAPKRTLLPAV